MRFSLFWNLFKMFFEVVLKEGTWEMDKENKKHWYLVIDLFMQYTSKNIALFFHHDSLLWSQYEIIRQQKFYCQWKLFLWKTTQRNELLMFGASGTWSLGYQKSANLLTFFSSQIHKKFLPNFTVYSGTKNCGLGLP